MRAMAEVQDRIHDVAEGPTSCHVVPPRRTLQQQRTRQPPEVKKADD